MKRYILIQYDTDKVVDGEKNYDLFGQVCDTFDNAKIRAHMTEFTELDNLKRHVGRMK